MIRVCSLLLPLLVLVACGGDTGPTGPQGQQGPQGPAGDTGPMGLPGNVDAFELVEHAVTDGDYNTGTGLLVLDPRITLATYLQTYVFLSSLPIPAHVTLQVFGSEHLDGTATPPHVAVLNGGLIVTDPDRSLLGMTLFVAVLPQ